MKRTLIILAIVVAGLAAAAVRVVLEGRAALVDGDEAMAAKRPADAIAAWEAAARWYLPGAPHVDEAYRRLVELATSDPATGLAAWRAVRSAALATRTFWTPHEDELDAANAAIAQRSADDVEGSLASGHDNADKRAWHRASLDRAPYPNGLFTLVSIGGIALWIVGVLWLIARGLDESGVRRGALVLGVAVTAIGAAAWAAGLYNA